MRRSCDESGATIETLIHRYRRLIIIVAHCCACQTQQSSKDKLQRLTETKRLEGEGSDPASDGIDDSDGDNDVEAKDGDDQEGLLITEKGGGGGERR